MARKRLYAVLPDGRRVTRLTEKDHKYVVVATRDGKKWEDRGWRSSEKGAQMALAQERRWSFWTEVRLVRVAGITTMRDK